MTAIKKIIINLTAFVLALSAGIIFLGCSPEKIPSGVTVDGIPVGGLTYCRAADILRGNEEEECRAKTLVLYGKNNTYVFKYPEIGYKDDLSRLLRSSQKNGRYSSGVTYYLKGGDEVLDGIVSAESSPAEEPYFDFSPSGEPFTYHGGADGFYVDKPALSESVEKALNGGDGKVTLNYVPLSRRGDLQALKEQTALLASYTTYFDGSNLSRTSNIRLAANLLNGKILQAESEFSFNSAVGARTQERGFLSAKIIEDGEFVEGVGGGVCQVSTTLYNAALLAGCKITEYHPHSLAVSYVPPSRDAMVSGQYCDLKFTCRCNLYIRAETGENFVAFRLYGKPDGYKYSIESEVKEILPPPEEEGDSPREGKAGIVSDGYLVAEKDGVRTRVLLRSDRYSPQKRVTVRE